MVDKPEMYNMEHYLKDAQSLPKEALAIVSDTDLLGYEKEYAVYQKIQQDAVHRCSEIVEEVKERRRDELSSSILAYRWSCS